MVPKNLKLNGAKNNNTEIGDVASENRVITFPGA